MWRMLRLNNQCHRNIHYSRSDLFFIGWTRTYHSLLQCKNWYGSHLLREMSDADHFNVPIALHYLVKWFIQSQRKETKYLLFHLWKESTVISSCHSKRISHLVNDTLKLSWIVWEQNKFRSFISLFIHPKVAVLFFLSRLKILYKGKRKAIGINQMVSVSNLFLKSCVRSIFYLTICKAYESLIFAYFHNTYNISYVDDEYIQKLSSSFWPHTTSVRERVRNISSTKVGLDMAPLETFYDN